ncbi:MAG: insulinase family protein [Elusimicrobiota bacterium]|nr:insulinase family protein [Elusimicrobiota bacterium]
MDKKNVILLILAVVIVYVFFSLKNSDKKTEIVNYDNGLSAVFNQDKKAEVVSVFVFVRAGAIDEKQPSQSGLSHYLEHMMFKGSKNYPEGLFNSIESFGGQMNASTGKQLTTYYINAPKENVYEIITMLADAMQNPIFPQETIDTERNVIIEELFLRRGWTGFKLAETLEDTIYKGSPMANNVGGTPAIIAKSTRQDLFDYYNKHYIPSKMVVSVAGNFNMRKVKKLTASSFGKFENKPAPQEPNLDKKSAKRQDIVIRDNISAGLAAFAFLGPDIRDADFVTADVAASVLNLYLYRSLKIKFSLVNSVSAYFDASLGAGYFDITVSFDPKNYKEIKMEIERQLEYLLQNEISQEDIDRAKISIKTAKNFAAQTQYSIASEAGHSMIMQRKDLIDMNLYLYKVEAVSAADIKNFLNKYYSKEKMVSVAMLPKGF